MTQQLSTARKGIIMAGGSGTRLFPLTSILNKHLLPVYDKPMIYYPITTLMLSGVREIMLITTPEQLPLYRNLLGDGEKFGVCFEYAIQDKPRGIAEAVLIAESFLEGHAPGSFLILGDNILWGHYDVLRQATSRARGATIFAYPVQDPSRYGVVSLGSNGKALLLEEKPSQPQSNLAVPGLYLYDEEVVELAKQLHPSARGILEVTDLNRLYLQKGMLEVRLLGRGMAWLDAGTPDSLLEAADFVGAVERRQGLKIGCPEEVALHMGYVTGEEMARTIQIYPAGNYRKYIEGLIENG